MEKDDNRFYVYSQSSYNMVNLFCIEMTRSEQIRELYKYQQKQYGENVCVIRGYLGYLSLFLLKIIEIH